MPQLPQKKRVTPALDCKVAGRLPVQRQPVLLIPKKVVNGAAQLRRQLLQWQMQTQLGYASLAQLHAPQKQRPSSFIGACPLLPRLTGKHNILRILASHNALNIVSYHLPATL